MSLEERVNKIEERNKKVELNKSWETSWTRRICIMILTYIVVVFYSYLTTKINNIFLISAIINLNLHQITFHRQLITHISSAERAE